MFRVLSALLRLPTHFYDWKRENTKQAIGRYQLLVIAVCARHNARKSERYYFSIYSIRTLPLVNMGEQLRNCNIAEQLLE